MIILSFLKWLSYITTSIIVLFLGVYTASSLLDHKVPINQSTRTCLVTGASSGIGYEIAQEMVKRGWKVIGVARRSELLNKLQQKLGEQAFIPVVCDVANLDQVYAVSEKIKAQKLNPTLFFLNAGMGELKQKWDFSVVDHQRTFATNYFGTIAWIKEWLLPVKKCGGGTFVAISSVDALLATPNSEAYATSKRALVHCFDALRRQYLYDNIGFSIVLPGPVATEMLKGQGAHQLPFIHKAEDEARYIVKQVFAGKKQVEPSWFYSVYLRLLGWLPDSLLLRAL